MSITLNWSNRGQAVTSVKIYRNLHRGETPTLLTTLNTPDETYTDTTAEMNKLYFYRVALVIGTEEVPGTVVPMMSVNDTGPGPKALVAGTMEYGYFGTLTPDEFLTTADVQRVGGPSGFTSYSSGTIALWRKFANMGKIIYIPNAPVWQITTANTGINALQFLYSSGYLYGGGGTDRAPGLTGSYAQNRKATLGAYEFYVRAPNAEYDRDPTTQYTTGASLNTYGGEVSMVASANNYGPIQSYISAGAGWPRIAPPTTLTAVGHSYVLTSTMANNLQATFFANQQQSVGTSVAGTSANTTFAFLTILELILG